MQVGKVEPWILSQNATSQNSSSTPSWDPVRENEAPAQSSCIMRITHDLRNIHEDPIPGILVVPHEDDITLCYALVIGPEGTPYEGGFFFFLLRFPYNYPLGPPRVRLLTTDEGAVRFNPNLYANGKVCLSILGTWAGPPWSPAQTLSSVLISIQSLMCEDPYFNEPGFSSERSGGESARYKTYIAHETIRVAVCDNITKDRAAVHGSLLPRKLRYAMLTIFPDYYDSYISVCVREQSHDNSPMRDPFNRLKSDSRYRFDFLKERLSSLKAVNDTEILELQANLDSKDIESCNLNSKEAQKKSKPDSEATISFSYDDEPGLNDM